MHLYNQSFSVINHFATFIHSLYKTNLKSYKFIIFALKNI